jgi:hypothetical protein
MRSKISGRGGHGPYGDGGSQPEPEPEKEPEPGRPEEVG